MYIATKTRRLWPDYRWVVFWAVSLDRSRSGREKNNIASLGRNKYYNSKIIHTVCKTCYSIAFFAHVFFGKIWNLMYCCKCFFYRQRIPKHQWWLKLRPLLRILAKHDSAYEEEGMYMTVEEGSETDALVL